VASMISLVWALTEDKSDREGGGVWLRQVTRDTYLQCGVMVGCQTVDPAALSVFTL